MRSRRYWWCVVIIASLSGLIGQLFSVWSSWLAAKPDWEQNVIAGLIVALLSGAAIAIWRVMVWIGRRTKQWRTTRTEDNRRRTERQTASRRKRGVAELLEIEPDADAAIVAWGPAMNAMLEDIGSVLNAAAEERKKFNATIRDHRLQRKHNRELFDKLADQLSRKLPALEARVVEFEKPANDLGEVYAGVALWASQPRYGTVSLDPMKARLQKAAKVCGDRLLQINGIIESAYKSMGGQTRKLDEVLDEYARILKRWATALSTLKAGAEKVG